MRGRPSSSSTIQLSRCEADIVAVVVLKQLPICEADLVVVVLYSYLDERPTQ